MLSCLQRGTGGDQDPRWWRKWETIPNTALGKWETTPNTALAKWETPPNTALGKWETPPNTALGKWETPPNTALGKWETPPNTALGKWETTPNTALGKWETPPNTALGKWETPPNTALGKWETPPNTALGKWETGGGGSVWASFDKTIRHNSRNIFLQVDLPWLTSLMIMNDPSQYCAQSKESTHHDWAHYEWPWSILCQIYRFRFHDLMWPPSLIFSKTVLYWESKTQKPDTT